MNSYFKYIIISIILFLTIGLQTNFAQDYIYTKRGEKIASTIISIQDNIINYKLHQSRDISIKNISIDEVSMIDYQEGGIEFISNLQKRTSKNQEYHYNQNQNNSDKSKSTFDKIITNDGRSLNTFIVKVFPKVIQYRYTSQPNGPIRNILTSNVNRIVYSSGVEKYFNRNEQQIDNNTLHTQKPQYQNTKESTLLGDGVNFSPQLYTSFILGAGYGNSYGGAGLKAQVLFNVDDFKVGLHGGAGYYFEELDINSEKIFSYSAGLKLYFWKGLNLDLQYGGFGVNKSLDGTKMLVGPSGLLGYELEISRKLSIELAGGTCYDLNGINKIWIAYDSGILYKF